MTEPQDRTAETMGRAAAAAGGRARFGAYVALAAPGRREAWRPVAMIGLILLTQMLMLVLATAFAAHLLGAPPSQAGGAQGARAQLLIALVCLAATPFALAAGLRALHGRRLSSLYGPARRLEPRGLLFGAACAALLTGIGLAAATQLDLATLSWSRAPAAGAAVLIVVFLLIPLQAAGEELLFRGYLLQEIARRSRLALFWAAAPSALFAALHIDAAAPLDEAISYALWSFLFGLAAAAIVWRSGALSIVIGLHVANNWIALLLFEPAQGVAGLGPIEVRLTPGGAAATLALNAVLLAGLYGIVALALRRREARA
ncbi:MAG: type II CAAX endopeptidase family protein [Pseudomonadota bacterium]